MVVRLAAALVSAERLGRACPAAAAAVGTVAVRGIVLKLKPVGMPALDAARGSNAAAQGLML